MIIYIIILDKIEFVNFRNRLDYFEYCIFSICFYEYHLNNNL